MKLSLNKAAKEANVAKATLLDALKSGRLSAAKGDKGYWEIDPSELFRVFPKTGSGVAAEPTPTPHENHIKTTHDKALEVEIKMLREQLAFLEAERDRERDQLGDQIQNLREQIDRQNADHRQILSLLTDQRDKAQVPVRGFWSSLFSK